MVKKCFDCLTYVIASFDCLTYVIASLLFTNFGSMFKISLLQKYIFQKSKKKYNTM